MTKWEIINSLTDISIGVTMIALNSTPINTIINQTDDSTIIPETTTSSSTIDPWPPILMENNKTEIKELQTSPIIMGTMLIIKGLIPVGKKIIEKLTCNQYQEINNTDNTSEITIFNMESARL